jgi:hypothetical protein
LEPIPKNDESKVPTNAMKTDFLGDKREARLREGVWQYMIDHSHILRDGRYRIIITTSGAANFWKRVDARIRGDYKRYNLEETDNEKQTLSFKIMKRKMDAFGKICSDVDKGNDYRKKFLLWLYRYTRDKLQDEDNTTRGIDRLEHLHQR